MTRVDTSNLSCGYPWFLQAGVPAQEDVTAVYIRGALFAYSLERNFLKEAVDWRQFISPEQIWFKHALPEDVTTGIRAYMEQRWLDYGRIDFLLDRKGRYWFCEVNPTGQFAWLDLTDQDGLLFSVAQTISVKSLDTLSRAGIRSYSRSAQKAL